MTYVAKRTKGRDGAPLLLTFHGTGGTEDQFHELGQSLVPGAHVVSPRGDVSEVGALRYFRRTGEGVYDFDDLSARTKAMADFIRSEKEATGASQIFGLGYSNGANILASVMLEQPELVDAAVLFHPLIPWDPAPVPGLATRKVLITAGERDPICPPALTRSLEAYLQAQGAEVSAVWHPGGHELRSEELQAAQAFLTGALA